MAYQNQGRAPRSPIHDAGSRLNRRNARKLANGDPATAASKAPTKSAAPSAKPASTASARTGRRVRHAANATSGTMRTPSLQRVAIAAAAARPAPHAASPPASSRATRRNAARRRVVEIGRGKGIVAYPNGSQCSAKRNAAARATAALPPSARVRRPRSRMPADEKRAVGTVANQASARGPWKPSASARRRNGATKRIGWKSERKAEGT